jgi:hypothetical protein
LNRTREPHARCRDRIRVVSPNLDAAMNPTQPGVPQAAPEALTEADRLDWEARIEAPPVRPSGKIEVRLRYSGRSQPLPVEPQDESAEADYAMRNARQVSS